MAKLRIECDIEVSGADREHLTCHASAVYFTEGGPISRLHAVAAMFAAAETLSAEAEELAKPDAKWDEAAKVEERPN